MDNITLAPGPEAPSIRIAGRTYTLEYSLLAQYMISKWGLVPTDIFQAVLNKAPNTVHLVMTLLAAMAAHNFIKGPIQQAVPDADWWAAMIPTEEWPKVTEAIGAVLKPLLTPKPMPPATEDQALTGNATAV